MRRNRARWLAPLALAATATATYLVVQSQLNTSSTSTTQTQVVHGSFQRGQLVTAKFYSVQPGDTLSSVARKTGVSLATLERLNPSINPNSLQTSQRLRLRR